MMTPADQVRLNILRLEVDRIRIEMRHQQMLLFATPNRVGNNTPVRVQPQPQPKASCCICFETFTSGTITIASFCGHVYCRTCYSACKRLNNRCGVCTQNFKPNHHYRLYFIFNNNQTIVCTKCAGEITTATRLRATRCGCVFCEQCFGELSIHCIRCRNELGGSNRVLSLILTYN